MKAVIAIEMDGAAFEDNAATELGRILKKLSYRIVEEGAGAFDPVMLLDLNGNRVGEFRIEGE